MKRISIDQTLLERILNYIATKPYNEVQGLISSIQQDIKPIKEEDRNADSAAVQ